MTRVSGNDVTIIGAGIVGIMTALHLQEEGFNVSVIDRLEPGEGCSRGNAGVLGSATCIPISMPGTLNDVPRWLLDRKGPLTINWRHSAGLLPWLIRFLRAGTRESVEKISTALNDLHEPTVDIYTRYARLANAGELIQKNGYLHLFESEKSFDNTRLAREIRTRRGIKFDELSAADVKEIEPGLGDVFHKGILIERDGFTPNPLRPVQSLAALFRQRGGTLLREEVTSIRFERGLPTALTTSAGKHDFGRLVVCAGAWSKTLLDQLGEKVYLESERVYHALIRNPTSKCPALSFSTTANFSPRLWRRAWSWRAPPSRRA